VNTTDAVKRRPQKDAAVPHVGSELPRVYQLQLALTRLVVGPLRRRFWRRERELPPPLSGDEVLHRLVEMPVSTWEYDFEPGVRHLGPMAQDFAATFGLGRSNRIIQMHDANGVNIVAIQALARRVFKLEEQVADLRARLDDSGSPT
jgi:hypothetical protein